MPDAVVIYTVLHQPRRPRLPAPHLSWDLSPKELAEAIFDEPLNRRYFQKVARYCYRPAVEAFARHLDAGLKLNIGFSFSFLRQARQWDPQLVDSLSRLVSHPNVEIIGVEPYHSFLFWLDIRHFVRRMQWMSDELQRLFGKRPVVTDTTEMILTPEIYAALQSAGFRAVLTEGRKQLLDWRSPGFVYVAPGGRMRILARHNTLSDDVGYRFSNRQWDGYPLLASDYVRWLRDSEGDLVLLGWDFETFGEHHPVDSGIFDFLNWLPGELAHQGVSSLTATEALDRFQGRVEPLDLPASPITWAGAGDMGFFLGNPIQQRLFHLMRHAYHLCTLAEEPELLDIALWLAQSDNLHLLQWFEEWGSAAEVSAYFTPDEWWGMGGERMLSELQRTYSNFVEVVSERLARRSLRRHIEEEVELPRQASEERPAPVPAPVAAFSSPPEA
jgi:alpha-amylase